MASGSADKTVKLWDIDTCKVHTTFSHATDKVQKFCKILFFLKLLIKN